MVTPDAPLDESTEPVGPKEPVSSREGEPMKLAGASIRKLHSAEKAFVLKMLADSTDRGRYIEKLSGYLVEEMADEGMGSLEFISESKNRVLGPLLAEISFNDADGVPVIATLNLDADGGLYELDIWKTDFSELKRFPN